MKISFIHDCDAANVLTSYSHLLNKHTTDIASKSIGVNIHPFNYNIPHDIDLNHCTQEELTEASNWIKTSDLIIFSEDGVGQNYDILNKISNYINFNILNSDKRLIIWHPGSQYRNNYHHYNIHPNRSRIEKHLYAIDLFRLSPKSNIDFPIMPYHYVDFDINQYVDKFKQKLQTYPRTILHIPSKVSTKGSNIIDTTIQNLHLPTDKLNYKMLTDISYRDAMAEKEKSLFYIDQFSPNLTGGIGVAAFEGIIYSNLTFACTNLVGDSIPLITGEDSTPVVDLGKTVESMESTLNGYLNLSDSDLIDIITAIGQWMEKYYSPEFIKNQLIKIITK